MLSENPQFSLNVTKLCPSKKEELDRNFPLFVNYCLIEKDF